MRNSAKFLSKYLQQSERKVRNSILKRKTRKMEKKYEKGILWNQQSKVIVRKFLRTASSIAMYGIHLCWTLKSINELFIVNVLHLLISTPSYYCINFLSDTVLMSFQLP